LSGRVVAKSDDLSAAAARARRNDREYSSVVERIVAHNLNLNPFEEACVRDNSEVLAATIIGAVIGGAAGYFLFTDHGRVLRRRLEPAIEDFARELNSFRGTIEKAANVASEGWKFLNEALNEGRQPPPRYPGTHQTAPF
jgi:hypothetical protein